MGLLPLESGQQRSAMYSDDRDGGGTAALSALFGMSSRISIPPETRDCSLCPNQVFRATTSRSLGPDAQSEIPHKLADFGLSPYQRRQTKPFGREPCSTEVKRALLAHFDEILVEVFGAPSDDEAGN